MLKVFTSKFSKAEILFIVLISISFRVFKLKELFSFDFDQQAAATAAYEFFKSGKLSFIGQQLSFQGLFLGPIYNWSQFIPYKMCNLLPDCVPYYFIFLSLITTVMLYIVAAKIFNRKIATTASVIWSVSFVSVVQDLGPSSNIFLFLCSVIILFSLYKYFEGDQKYLIPASFVAGLAVVNFNPIFILSSLIVPISAIIKKKFDLKIMTISVIAFLVNFTPLFIFNVRHDNLLLNALKNFYSQNTGSANLFLSFYNLLTNILLPFYSNFLFKSVNFFTIALVLFLLLFGIYKLTKRDNRFFPILPLWILVTFLGLVFYKGHIPDYYFWQTLLPFILIVAVALNRNFFLFVIVGIIILYTNLSALINFHSEVNYQLKKEAISYILADSKGESFNVYYDFPPGLNTGYSYLFKAYGREPVEGGKNLYILTFFDPKEFNLEKYKSSDFKNKVMRVKTAGFIQVVSIK